MLLINMFIVMITIIIGRRRGRDGRGRRRGWRFSSRLGIKVNSHKEIGSRKWRSTIL